MPDRVGIQPCTAGNQDTFTEVMVNDLGYLAGKRLDDGTYVGVMRLLFTLAICIGVTPHKPFDRRYCFEDVTLCIGAYNDLKTGKDVPEGWVAKRVAGSEAH